MDKCALFDTDFISKLHITRKDDANRLIDRIMELPGYQFVCHKQIYTELSRHNASAVNWLQRKINEASIQEFTDLDILTLLRPLYGKNNIAMFLFYLSNSCGLFDRRFYGKYYAELEKLTALSETEFAAELSLCDADVGCDNNLGEIKTYLLQQVLQNAKDIPLYIFCSDDRRARTGISETGGVPCISAISSFYVLKERLNLDRDEAKLYFDSWMQLHQARHQTAFKVHKNTKEMQLVKMDGYEIFNRIYDGTITILKNGNLKIRE